jgi:hypothetical protein
LRNVWQQEENDTEDALSPFLTEELQSLLAKCIQTPVICDELYLQLIKMTTNNPEPDAYQSIAVWNVMSVAVGIVMPLSPLVFEYLSTHLKRYTLRLSIL